MTIKKELKGDSLTYVIEGHIDTSTAPEFDNELKKDLGNVNHFDLDLEHVDYISSAGLRVILMASKTMKNKGGMNIVNTPKNIKELFDLTGFSEVLNIE